MTSDTSLPNLIANLDQMRRMNDAWAEAGKPLPDADDSWRKVADIYGCSDNELRELRNRLRQSPPATAPFSVEGIAELEGRIKQLQGDSARPLTTTLNDGTVVLAKLYKGEPSALTYANRSQANKAAAKVQGDVIGTRPFYVRVSRSSR